MIGGDMGYKKLGDTISFADLAVERTLEHNRSVDPSVILIMEELIRN